MKSPGAVLLLLTVFCCVPALEAQSNHPNISVLQDDGTIVVPANAFDLAGKSLVFTPQGKTYTAQSTTGTFDQGAGNYVTLPLADDDSYPINLPFAFTFYGTSYNTAFINTDGSVTFGVADFATSNRSLHRVISGPPRVSAFLDDLITSQGGAAGFVAAEAFSDRVNIYWIGVIEYPSFASANFEIILMKNGTIKINYASVSASQAVVGISPGNAASYQPIDFSQQTSAVAVPGVVAEVFSAQVALDLEAVGQRFYADHPDSYDSLMVFTDFDINTGSVANSVPVRNQIQGIIPANFAKYDFGAQYGSGSRLSLIVQGGSLSQYPTDPNEVFINGRTTMTVLAQQFGHRWLSYADVNPAGMLRPNSSNWSFLMNANGSVMEGNEIEARADGSFKTVTAKVRFSPLDQYLMGLRSPDDVPPWFVVTNPTLITAPTDFSCTPLSALCSATAGVEFSGTRRDLTIQNVITTMGTRAPAYPDAQKDFSAAFVLVTKSGQPADPSRIAHLDTIRTEWEKFFPAAVENRATMTTALQYSGLLTQLPANGSISTETGAATAAVQVGYGTLNTGTGVAVLRSFSGTDLVSEAAVPATSAANRWIMYAEKDGAGISTGVAIANPGKTAATLSLTLSNGAQATLQLPAGGQHAAFVDELFGTLQTPFLGTLTVQSDVPVAILALRGTSNAKGQFIISTIPLSSSAPDQGGFAAFPIITDGGGYNTELILVNAGATATTGTIGFSFSVATDLGTASQFTFNIPAGGVWRIRTKGNPSAVTSGYAALSVTADNPMPNATALIRLSSKGDLTSETAVPAQSQITRGLMFGTRETNRRTGIAILNPGAQSVQVTLTPLDTSGNPVGSPGTLTLTPFTQKSAFLDEFISTLPIGFEGTVLLESPSPVFAISLRGTTDSHNGFLMSTLPVMDLNQSYSGPHYFPQVVDGGGFSTEFLMLNAGTNLVQLVLFGSDGQRFSVTLR